MSGWQGPLKTQLYLRSLAPHLVALCDDGGKVTVRVPGRPAIDRLHANFPVVVVGGSFAKSTIEEVAAQRRQSGP